jgi:hypothetical protein
MNEKGIIMGVLAKLKVICSRKHKKIRITQQGKKKWVSLIEFISSDRRILSPYVIFKAKILLKAWYNEFREDSGEPMLFLIEDKLTTSSALNGLKSSLNQRLQRSKRRSIECFF